MNALTTTERTELAQHETTIERGLGSFVAVGLALMAIRDSHLYKEEYPTFAAYCRGRWKMDRQRAYQLIDGAVTAENVKHVLQIEPPQNDRQARELSKLKDPIDQAEAWRRAFEDARDGVITAAKVKAVITEIKKEKQIKEDAPTSTLSYLLLHGDFREQAEFVKDGSVDLIVTDPPYPEEYLDLYDGLGQIATRVLRPGGSLLAMSGQSFLPSIYEQLNRYLTYHWTLAYMLPGATTQLWERQVLCRWKPVLWFTNGEYTGGWVDDVCTSPGRDKGHHHWGQSESGMVDILRRFAGDVVLDPMCGAGTTGVAALSLGRRFIGIDCDEDALKVAASRLMEAHGQGQG